MKGRKVVPLPKAILVAGVPMIPLGGSIWQCGLCSATTEAPCSCCEPTPCGCGRAVVSK